MLDVLFLPVSVFNQPRYTPLVVEQGVSLAVVDQPPAKRRKIDPQQIYTYFYKTPSLILPPSPCSFLETPRPSSTSITEKKRSRSDITLSHLPNELLDHIFGYLPISTARTVTRLVCRTWNEIVLAPSFWKDFVLPRSSSITADKYIDILTLPRFSQLHTVAFGWDQRVDDDVICKLFIKNPHLLSTVTTFEVQRCHGVSDAAMHKISELKNIQHLRLYNSSNWRGITDKGLKELSQLSSLRTLQLNYFKRISNDGLANIGQLTELKELILVGSCLVADQGIKNLSTLHNLTSLAISLCGTLTNNSLRMISTNFPLLDHLALGYNNPNSVFTDEGLQSLLSLAKLKELRLERTWGLLQGSGARLLKQKNPDLLIRQW